MAGTQLSMENYLNSFTNAVSLLQNDTEYNPVSIDIQQKALVELIDKLNEANNNIKTLETQLREFKKMRNEIAFKRNSSKPENTIENIVTMMTYYFGAENGKESIIYKMIVSYKKKMNPPVKKNNDNQKKKNKNPEKKFGLLESYFRQIINLLEQPLNRIYEPNNPILQIENMKTLYNSLERLNFNIYSTELNLKSARQIRLSLFNGKNGAKERVTIIKLYLSSYVGGKKNEKYLAFVNEFK